MNRAVLLIISLIFIGCSESSHNAPTTFFSGTAMTIDYKIIIGQKLSEKQKAEVERIILTTFEEVNQIYNKYNPASEISKLNRLAAGIHEPISPKLESILIQTEKIVNLSENRFDPTIEPLQNLWRKKLENGQMPSSQEIEEIKPAIGWDKIHFNNGIFYKDHDLTSLDLGGIAKGLCVDLIVERLSGAGYKDTFVEWGGEIRASGRHPDKRPWNIFISRLGDANPDQAIEKLSLKDQAIATSGDYLQFWTVIDSNADTKPQETTFFHIIDPKTLSPLKITKNSIASASVLASTCAYADALATVLMLFPTADEAKLWAESLKNKENDFSFWIITREGF